MNDRRVRYAAILLLLLTLCALLLMALVNGAVHFAPMDIASALLSDEPSLIRTIVIEIRLPRALLAALVGATLALAGAALQGVFRNPLAEPGLLGVSSFASLGAVIAIYYGISAMAWFVLPALAIVGALLGVGAMLLLAGQHRHPVSLLLAGVALNAFASSAIALALNLAPNPYAMSEMVYWLLGSFANRSLAELALVLPFIAVGLLLCWRQRWLLDALALGDDTAQTLGFAVARQRAWLLCGVAMAVGAAVSVSGSIGFVGLFVPHLLRPLLRQQPSQLLAWSALVGAVFLLAADLLVQQLGNNGPELKVGVITALIGAPFFLVLVLRQRGVEP